MTHWKHMTDEKMCLVIAAALVALWSATASAQGPQGTLSGVVRDGTGAALPGVTVTATNQTTNASQNATTGGDGAYSLSLPAGTYSVTASLTSFRRATQRVELGAGAMQQLNFSMELMLSEEVTVTAMKRETQLIDVPFSAAAPTAEVLRSRGVENLEGIAANVGGFTVQNLGPGQSQVAIRGLSAGQIVRDQPGVKEQVGVYLDESVISLSLFTPDIDLFDTDRVEVLRGPQGTLFGAGSESGTVRYITNQPQLHVTSGAVEFDGSTVQHGNQAGNAKLAFNVPLGDKAALRVASYVDRAPGFIDAIQPNFSANQHVNDGIRAGVRATVKLVPTDRLTITPRVYFQKNDVNGWNRVDIFNILANPFTTSRPPVTLGNRSQFTQLQEKFTDNFVLGDVAIDYKLSSDLSLTSITSYNYRDILVVRDAGALTSSITGGNIGVAQSVYTLNSPLDDATKAKMWTEELRFAGSKQRLQWVGGGFFSHMNRHYGQDLPVIGFTAATGIPTKGLRAPQDSLFWSDLNYNLNQYAFFGEATVPLSPAFSVTGGLRFYHFDEDKAQIFDGIFGNDNNGTSLASQPGTTNANGVAPRVIATYKVSGAASVNAQVSRGFRLGGINDPLNVPLCTPRDLVTFGGRDTWKDEKTWNYEAGVKSRLPNGKGSVSASAFYMDIRDLQATVTAGSCSSRLIFNVPKARSQGVEAEVELVPTRNVDLALSSSFNDSTLRSTVTSTDAASNVSVVGGIQSGRRLPTVPRFQSAEAATFQWEVRAGSMAYVTATHQYIGSRFTQLGDQDLGTLNLLSFGANTIGRPLTASVFTYNPELPSYNIANLRVGVRRGRWDVSAFLNNLTDEHALLSLDQERGTRARIGYLINQPRTFGLSYRVIF
ncbi:MAG: TonB-dependent receptor [Acidobacteria bacterium]|nr:MAG: TonB-dependent receptor [Acidobacteriota bacterium]